MGGFEGASNVNVAYATFYHGGVEMDLYHAYNTRANPNSNVANWQSSSSLDHPGERPNISTTRNTNTLSSTAATYAGSDGVSADNFSSRATDSPGENSDIPNTNLQETTDMAATGAEPTQDASNSPFAENHTFVNSNTNCNSAKPTTLRGIVKHFFNFFKKKK